MTVSLVALSNTFWNFHTKNRGSFLLQFAGEAYFFNWVGKKPPTRWWMIFWAKNLTDLERPISPAEMITFFKWWSIESGKSPKESPGHSGQGIIHTNLPRFLRWTKVVPSKSSRPKKLPGVWWGSCCFLHDTEVVCNYCIFYCLESV